MHELTDALIDAHVGCDEFTDEVVTSEVAARQETESDAAQASPTGLPPPGEEAVSDGAG